ncbi:MAG: GNAT family N-acetyltransferase [Lacibacter sp.]
MNDLLQNPVFNALSLGDKQLSFGTDYVKYFDAEVSPYAGFPEDHTNGFAELYAMLPVGRRILFAKPTPINIPQGWQLQHEIKGLQFVYEGRNVIDGDFSNIVPLTTAHVDEMIELVRLTKPGPFDKRTIEFGSYHGIFVNDQLAAMTGQRLHVANYTEVSAVCTHPDHLGKGYASALMRHQMQIILNIGQIPFLHVREDNERAIAVYERLGFTVSRPMYFYFMKRL